MRDASAPPKRRLRRREGAAKLPPGRGVRARAAALARRVDVRFAIVGSALLAGAALLQSPASRLRAESRLEASIFKPVGEGGAGEEPDWEKIDLERRSFAMYLPQSRSLHYAWLGNDGLAADYVWMRGASYVNREFSRRYRGRKFEWLTKLYNTVVDLDPRWEGACALGATLLAAVGRKPDASLALLQKGMAANPDSWRLPYEAGLVCLLSPGRAAEAERYFRMAIQRPGHPEVIERVIARLTAEAGKLDLAIRHARSLAGRFDAMESLLAELNARKFERILNEAARRFREAEGRPPGGLASLRRSGLLGELDVAWADEHVLFEEAHARLAEMFRRTDPDAPGSDAPADEIAKALVESGYFNAAVLQGLLPGPEALDPFGKPYLYHAPGGNVRSEGLAEVDVSRTLAILRMASSKFASAKLKRATSLEEVGAFFAEWIEAGKALPQEWAPVFGAGKPPAHPLAAWGQRYTYDPATGDVDTTWKGAPEGTGPGGEGGRP